MISDRERLNQINATYSYVTCSPAVYATPDCQAATPAQAPPPELEEVDVVGAEELVLVGVDDVETIGLEEIELEDEDPPEHALTVQE